jgi:hypothetical protein
MLSFPRAKEELSWWTEHLARWNGKSQVLSWTLPSQPPAKEYTLAPTGPQERAFHISCLELLAAKLAVKTFLKGMNRKRILLLLDNTTAVAYIKNMGGTVSAKRP